MAKAKPMTSKEKELVRRYLVVDPASPSGLLWTGHWNGRSATWLTGRPYGSREDRYWGGMISGRSLRAHTLVWFLSYGEDPADFYPLTIDHVDRNGFNNTLSNLRLASKKGQASNRVVGYLKERDPLGVSGRRWVTPSLSRWKGSFSYNGKKVACGTFTTIDEAYQAVLEKRATMGLSIPKEESDGN